MVCPDLNRKTSLPKEMSAEEFTALTQEMRTALGLDMAEDAVGERVNDHLQDLVLKLLQQDQRSQLQCAISRELNALKFAKNRRDKCKLIEPPVLDECHHSY